MLKNLLDESESPLPSWSASQPAAVHLARPTCGCLTRCCGHRNPDMGSETRACPRLVALPFIRSQPRVMFLTLVLAAMLVLVAIANLARLIPSEYRISGSILKTPAFYEGWHDPDFSSTTERDQRDIIIVRWTSQWGEYDRPRILTNRECPYPSHRTYWGGGKSSNDDDQSRESPPETGDSGTSWLNRSCRITFDRRYAPRASAMVFHSNDLLHQSLPARTSMNLDQLWVYLQHECPVYTLLNLKAFGDVFNWTMTYRRDSNVYAPYGQVVPRHLGSMNKSSRAALPLTSSSRKRALVAWIVSSCDSDSKREYVVKALQAFVQVDVYGWCGLACPADRDPSSSANPSGGEVADCYAHVARSYKFYLSFENSLCTDYITEKFFTALRLDIVPVVFGGAKSSEEYPAVAPPFSYIDARAFPSVKELADYLIFLDNNEPEYSRYFEWKRKYEVVAGQGWCNLCQRVFEHETRNGRTGTRTWYADLWKWWNFMGYDTGVVVEQDDAVAGAPQPRTQSWNYLLSAPSCVPPHPNLTGGSQRTGEGRGTVPVVPDFEPGFFTFKSLRKRYDDLSDSWVVMFLVGAGVVLASFKLGWCTRWHGRPVDVDAHVANKHTRSGWFGIRAFDRCSGE